MSIKSEFISKLKKSVEDKEPLIISSEESKVLLNYFMNREPRLLQQDEVKHLKSGDNIYLEIYKGNGVSELVSLTVAWSDPKLGELEFKRCYATYRLYDYNRLEYCSWRAWTHRPSIQLMKATAWGS